MDLGSLMVFSETQCRKAASPIVVYPSSTSNSTASFGQSRKRSLFPISFPKTSSPIVVIEGGRSIFWSDEQLTKAWLPSVVSEGGRSIFWSDEQFKKARLLIFLMDFGSLMVFSDEQL